MINSESTVFVVDGDKNILVALRFLLEAEDLNVQTYSSAEAFLSRNNRHQTGCLLLDLRIPGINGLELQKLLCSGATELPIVIIAGRGDRLMTIRALETGAIDVFEKPFEDHALLKRIHRALAREE